VDPRTKRTIIVCTILAVIAAVLLLLALGALEDAVQRSRPGTGTANAVTGTNALTGTTTVAPKAAPRSAVRVLTPGGEADDPDAPAPTQGPR
jgi:hypothetical protein